MESGQHVRRGGHKPRVRFSVGLTFELDNAFRLMSRCTIRNDFKVCETVEYSPRSGCVCCSRHGLRLSCSCRVMPAHNPWPSPRAGGSKGRQKTRKIVCRFGQGPETQRSVRRFVLARARGRRTLRKPEKATGASAPGNRERDRYPTAGTSGPVRAAHRARSAKGGFARPSRLVQYP
jgi:hypothetical protein